MRSLWTWSSRLPHPAHVGVPHRSHLTPIDPPCPFESQTDGDHPFNTPRRPSIHGLPDPQHRLRSPRLQKSVKNISSCRGIGVLNADMRLVSQTTQRDSSFRPDYHTLPGFQAGVHQWCSQCTHQTLKIPGYHITCFREVQTISPLITSYRPFHRYCQGLLRRGLLDPRC